MVTIEIYGPGITYQYVEDGTTDSQGMCVEMDQSIIASDAANVPLLWQKAFQKQWPKSSREPDVVLSRLRELVGETLAALPDNSYCQRHAWLVGLIDDCSERGSIAARVIAIRGEAAEQEERALAKRVELERLQSLAEIVSTGDRRGIRGPEGMDYATQYTVRHKSTGRTFELTLRDLFDVGQVINPQPTAPEEVDCHRLVAAMHPFHGVRM